MELVVFQVATIPPAEASVVLPWTAIISGRKEEVQAGVLVAVTDGLVTAEALVEASASAVGVKLRVLEPEPSWVNAPPPYTEPLVLDKAADPTPGATVPKTQPRPAHQLLVIAVGTVIVAVVLAAAWVATSKGQEGTSSQTSGRAGSQAGNLPGSIGDAPTPGGADGALPQLQRVIDQFSLVALSTTQYTVKYTVEKSDGSAPATAVATIRPDGTVVLEDGTGHLMEAYRAGWAVTHLKRVHGKSRSAGAPQAVTRGCVPCGRALA